MNFSDISFSSGASMPSGGGFGENAKKIRDFLTSRYPNAAIGNGTDALNLIGCSNYLSNVGALICGTGSALFILADGELFLRRMGSSL